MTDVVTSLAAKLDVLRGKRIFLYGAKNLGDFAYKLLKHYNIMPAGYVLTRPVFKRMLNGLPIYGIEELDPVADKDAVILLTLNEKYHAEVKELLRQKGFANIDDTFTGFDFYHTFFSEVCTEIFKRNGISLSDEILEFGNYRQLNPYLRDDMKSFFLEAADLILPPFFGNYDYITEGPYEYESVALSRGDTVIDCGANIGLFSCYAASRGCVSYAFEPIGGHLANILQKHSALYDFRIKHCPYALADKHGEMKINLSPHDESASLVMWSEEESSKAVAVNVTTIDKFVRDNNLERVDFIKADIEGAERLMLAGAKETLRRFAPKLAICTYHLDDDPQVLESIIKDANPDYSVLHQWKKLFAAV